MAYTTIDKPDDYFNTVLYTGMVLQQEAITGVGFQPDLLWIKTEVQDLLSWIVGRSQRCK
jgi:hypothetical protein